jgi:hypothetical protein
MNKFLVGVMSAAMLAVSGVASADNAVYPSLADAVNGTNGVDRNAPYPSNYSVNEYHPNVSQPSPYHLRVGFGMDFGVPSAAAVGVVVNPGVDWVRLQASLTYNYLTFGGRGSLQLDPLALLPKCPIGLFADLQGGFFPQANFPGHSDLPQVGYDYVNTYLGLRLGRPNGFHWNIEAGPSYIAATTKNFQAAVNQSGLTIGDPKASGWIAPTFETGFSVVF